MHYWSETVGASVFLDRDKIGQVEDSVIDPVNKAVEGFLLERKSTEIRYRFLPFTQIKEIKRDSIRLNSKSGIIVLAKNFTKSKILIRELMKKPIIDEKGEWIGRVVDVAFDENNGILREIIISGSVVDDLWLGRKKMPVLDRVEFSRELIQIDRDTKEKIIPLQKGLKKLLNMDSSK
ncbi:hypothetical protein CSTERTH_06805 [Thermoclostridium stercorarium subsp. thermolacticum DSM 2910]|uniref:PRC-barrel domain-containing protein n=2 Tax=Thermoclostridium stercorarium TaxID=1510 RepID=A0A1B1YKJ2_THEST|nr:PRC-barrel domain-containing protein [Thermoclostridium stercorarium]ANW98756.1 hypothetical protein CSTERTH_06805 [Thermoclostridium stercorarium subsp. thermolacticum DSM 2910]ANX01273.1 hypothetical protein CSTERLE_06665 [Thermoclostridium stercorarium subsp. leptospartum DSM 9219]